MDHDTGGAPDREQFTLINVFRVAAGDQHALAESVLATAREVAADLPGFLDATVLRSKTGERVVNFAHWVDEAAFQAFVTDPRAVERIAGATALGEPDGHRYVVAGRVGPPSPLAAYHLMQRYIAEQAWENLAEVVDVDGYTENCVGLTPGWVTGLPAAVDSFQRNVAGALGELSAAVLDAIESGEQAVIRTRVAATHVGDFLGVPATGRAISFDAVDIIRLRGPRIVWRWLLMDLWAAYRQMTEAKA